MDDCLGQRVRSYLGIAADFKASKPAVMGLPEALFNRRLLARPSLNSTKPYGLASA